MAINLKQPVVAVDLSGIVSASIQTATAARKTRQLELETEFQKAVGDGMSYDDQLKFLDKQLADEKDSSLYSEDTANELIQRIADTKKLARFSKYRTNYSNILTELKAGRANANEQLQHLNDLLTNETDPDLRLEIKNDIQDMSAEVKSMEDTMVSNQLKKAQYDGTESVLNGAIDLVKSKRASAFLEGREDEASTYDVWLTTLTKQLSETRINNKLGDIEVQMNTKGISPTAKLDQLTQLARTEDGTTPITVNNITYSSAQAYWSATRDAYLAGNGAGNFSDFFKELDDSYTETTNAAIRRDGLVTTMTLDRIATDFSNLKSRPEVAPFAARADNYQALILGSAIESTAKAIIDRANVTGDFTQADATLQSYAKKYNIDVESYRLPLASAKEQRVAQIASATGETPEQVSKRLGVENILTPEDKGFAIPEPAAPGATPGTPGATLPAPGRFAAAAAYTGGSIADFLKMAGGATGFDAQAKLAQEYGIANYRGTAEQNIALLGKLKAEAKGAPAPGATPPGGTPETPGVTPPAPTPNPGITPPGVTPPGQTPPAQNVPTPAVPKAPEPAAPAPVAPPAPTPPKPAQAQPLPDAAKNYKGASIVDFLSLSGQDTGYTNRQRLAVEQGIVTEGTQYKGTAEQNTALLKKLRGY